MSDPTRIIDPASYEAQKRADEAEDRRVAAEAADDEKRVAERDTSVPACIQVATPPDDGLDTHDPAEDRFWREEKERREEPLDPDPR